MCGNFISVLANSFSRLAFGEETLFHLACVVGAKRGGGRGREKGKRERSPLPLPNPPPLFPFLPIPYPLPLSTPATQATSIDPEMPEKAIILVFISYLVHLGSFKRQISYFCASIVEKIRSH